MERTNDKLCACYCIFGIICMFLIYIVPKASIVVAIVIAFLLISIPAAKILKIL